MKILSTPNIIFLILVAAGVVFLTYSNFVPSDMSSSSILLFMHQLTMPVYVKFTACLVTFIVVFAIAYNVLRLRQPAEKVRMIDYSMNFNHDKTKKR